MIAAAKGRCQACGSPTDEWEVDHIVALQFGGGNERSNLRAICEACHSSKSARETRERAKADRIRAQRLGTKPKRWKRKIGGRAVKE